MGTIKIVDPPRFFARFEVELGITEEKQRHLSTIIGAKEKRRRNRELAKKCMIEKRRSQGVKTREEYDAQRCVDKERTKELLKRMLDKQPNATNKELSAFLGLSVRQIQRLKKEMK
jgi:transcriptional regulator GlxA family with amidase domain